MARAGWFRMPSPAAARSSGAVVTPAGRDIAPSAGLPTRLPRSEGAHRIGLAVGIVILGLIAAVSMAAPLLAPHDPNLESVAGLAPDGGPLDPNATYWLGTDGKGRDVLSRLIYGGRATFLACLVAVAVATVVGLAIALLAASTRRRVGGLLMRATDIGLAVPGLLLAAAI